MKRRGIALPDWPETDRRLWAAALAHGRAAAWRRITAYHLESAYGLWLAHLAEVWPALLNAPPQERLTPATVASFTDWQMTTRSEMGALLGLGGVARLIAALAPDWDRTWLRRHMTDMSYRVWRRPREPRMAHPRDLVALGHGLMSEARSAERGQAGAIRYRDGLMISLLAHRPVRRSNLAAIRIGRELQRSGSSYLLRWQGAQMKSGRALDLPFPEALVPALERWLRDIRPLFAGADCHTWLWPSIRPGGLCAARIWRIITERTRTAFGEPMHPHLFRHAAATALAREMPEQAGLARDLLGHAWLDTTAQHYLLSGSLDASRGYAALISRLRARSQPGWKERDGD